MLGLMERLQQEGLAHRDIKPENILYNKGNYLLCDFDDMIEVEKACTPELTTVEYSSPEFLRHVRQPKEKAFDPWKLDVYALGLTLLFVCSMGRFSLE
jgi:serine/threonine protein kinase